LFDFLCCDSKNRENFDHYLNDYVHHFRGRPHFCVDLDASEKHLDPLKHVDKSLLACSNIFGCLRSVGITIDHAKSIRIHTERRMPTPAKITLAGENSCHMHIRKRAGTRACPEAYQANTGSKNAREGIKDVHGRIQPFRPTFIGTPGLLQPMDLLVKDSENGTWRVAGLELGGEWVCT
jgi:hypothetical protein